MIKYEFNKLIRNKLPARMINEGVKINSVKLDRDQYISKLKEKLIEEAHEVAQACDLNDIEIEIADVLEVIDALAEAYSIKSEDIERAKLHKSLINGTFDSDCYVNYVEVAEDNYKVLEYINNKNRPYKLEV